MKEQTIEGIDYVLIPKNEYSEIIHLVSKLNSEVKELRTLIQR